MKLALVAFALLAPLGLRAQETLLVCDGTATGSYAPIKSGGGSQTEFIYPASLLEEMEGASITAVKFFSSSSSTTNYSNTVTVYVQEVASSTVLSSAWQYNQASATKVYEGTTLTVTGGELVIEFTTPFEYQGGNLCFNIWSASNTPSVNYYYLATTSSCGYDYYITPPVSNPYSTGNYLPKAEFTYEPAQQGGDVCEKPTTCDVSNLAATSATLIWGGGSGTYNVELKAGSADWATVLSGTTLTTTTLTLQPTTTYQARVQSVCDGTTPTSGWKTSTSFTTPCASYDIPYTYGFEDAAPFDCWTVLSGTITRINGTPNTGSYRLDFRGTTSNMIALPLFNEATDHLRVEFWTRPESTGGNSGKFAIGYMTDIADASSFVAIETYNSTEMTTTYVKKTVDMVGVPANAIIAMRQFDCSTNYYWYVDDVTVKEIPSCVAPTALAANPSTTSAELSWTANSGETAWTLYYKKAADANYTEVTNATNPYTLQGLQAATSYLYYVVANCAAEDASEPSEPFAFATACDVIPAVGYSENFDGYSPAAASTPTTRELPTCWNYINECTYSSYMYYPSMSSYYPASYAHTGSNYIKLYSSYSSYYDYDPQPQYAILPEMSNLAGKFVTLWAKGTNATSTFKIGTMTDPADAGSFVAITEQALSTSYQEFEYVIPANAEGNYLAIMIDAATSSRTTNGVYIDDIQITEVPTCLKPSAFASSATTAHSATLSWTKGEAGQDAWQIAYSTSNSFAPAADFTPGDGEGLVGADNNTSFELTGLAQSTTYYAYVRANCGGGDYSAWNSTRISFSTPAGNRTPTGLTVDNATITSSQATASWTPRDGNTLHESYDIYWAPSTVNAVPDVPAAPNLISGITGTSQVITGLEAETQYKVWVRDNCGTDGYSNWSSTPFTFMTAADCQMPDGLAASNVTTNSATISWTTYGLTEFNLRYSTDGENWTTVNDVNSPYTFNGTLSSNTAYQVQVQPTCNTEVWTSSLEFTTLCDPITISAGHPWTEDFEAPVTTAVYNAAVADLVVPDCWDNYTSNTGTAYSIPHIIKSDAGSSGYNYSDPASQVLYFYGSGNGYAALPLFSNALDELQISFKWATESSSNGTLTLGYITAEDNGTYNTFTAIGDGYNANSQSQHQMKSETVYLNNVPNTATRLVFRWYYSSWYGANIDDIEVSMAPSCYPVGTLTKANEGPHSVELSWPLVDNGQTAWVVEYADNSEFNNIQTASANTHTDFELAGLTPETEYWVRVKADCGNDDYGEVSNVVNFTTGIACHAPTALAANNETTSSMVLSWTNGEVGQDAWVIAYKKEGDANFAEVNVATNPYTLTDLTDGKTYTLKVRANCGNVDGLSQWSGEITHATEASCPAPTNVAYSDVNPHGATITWDGEAANHDIEYRTVTTAEANETYDFEDGMQGWTTIDADGHGDAWSRNSGSSYAHDGTYSMKATYNYSYDHQDYLVSPQIALGGSVSFYAKKGGSYNDCFRVYLSTTGNASASDFTIELTNGDVTPTTTYTQYSYDLSSYSGMGYVAIVYTAPANQLNLYIDDINITATVISGYGAWQTVDNATSPYELNILNPETVYEVHVVGDCGATTSPHSDVMTFTTGIACYAPENFAVDNSTITHNSVELSWTATGGTSAWVVAYKADGDANFTEVENVTENAPYRLEGLDPETHYTVKVKSDCGGEGYSSWSEEKNFTTLEACAAPTAFVLDNVAVHQATFIWTAGNGNTAWKVYVKEHGAAEYPATYTDANTASATISELDAATAYDVKIVPTCDENKILEVENAFTTLCEAFTTFPWTEDFNSLTVANTIPVCWNNEEGTTTTASYMWCYTTTTGNGGCYGTGHNNTNCVRFNSYNNSNNLTNFLKSPVLSLPAGQPLQLKFWYKNPAGGDFSVYISTDGGATHETALATGLTGASSWTEHDAIDLSAYAGQDVVIVFKGTSNYGNGDAYIYLDDVTVEEIPVTRTLNVDANKWYAIASPVHNSGDNENLEGVTNLTSGTYDLYGYTEDAGTWDKPTTTLDLGKGYIYRRSTATTLSFVGYINEGNKEVAITSQCADANIAGFNLVGNPFPHAISRTDYYTLQPNGSWLAHDAGNIGEAEAFLVYTSLNSTDYEINDVTPSKKGAPAASPAITFTVSNGEFRDVAYARFDGSAVLPKIGHLEPNAPALSIPVNGKKYAIADLGNGCESFDMVFSGIGDYTISASGDATYLHLIDKVTGSDIDLLSQPYTFKAGIGDITSRFIVKLVPDGETVSAGNFAFRNGNGWTIEGDGTLEAYDALGRRIFAQEISSSNYQLSKASFPAAGVYVLRMGGNSQKIVVTE